MKRKNKWFHAIFLILGIIVSKVNYAQTGATCATAKSLTISAGQSTGWLTTTNDTLWYEFIATDTIHTFDISYRNYYVKSLIDILCYKDCNYQYNYTDFTTLNDSVKRATLINLNIGDTSYIALAFNADPSCGTCFISSSAYYNISAKTYTVPNTACSNPNTCALTTTCNLVCNGGFELIGGVTQNGHSYPDDISQITMACGWANANAATTDLYHTLGTSGFSQPCNLYGHETERTGNNAYAGFSARTSGTGGGVWQECIYSQLKSSLITGHTYIVSYYLSLSDLSGLNTSGNVGVAFSNNYTPSSNPVNINTVSGGINYAPTGNVLKSGWQQFTYTYTPVSSNEKYIIIGALKPPPSLTLSSTTTDCSNNPITYTAGAGSSYYYLDDISVVEAPGFSLSITQPTICLGGITQIKLMSPVGGTTYTWTSYPNDPSMTGQGTATIAVSPTVSTTYSLEINGGSCLNSGSMFVYVLPSSPSLNIGNSSPACYGTAVNMSANSTFSYSSFNWQPNNYTSSSPVYSPTMTTNTIFSVTATAGTSSCSATATTNVAVIPNLTFSFSPTTVCAGQQVNLSVSNPSLVTNLVVDWGVGTSTVSYGVSAGVPIPYTYSVAGTYTVNITGAVKHPIVNGYHCMTYSTQVITILPSIPPTLSITGSTLICSGQSTILSASGANTYTWQPGTVTSSTILLNPTSTSVYTITGANLCGITSTAAVTVSVNTTPTVAVSNATICSGTATTLTASGATTYSWNTGATTNTISLSPAITTIYTVTGTTSGCSDTKTVNVSVNTTPTIAVNNATICSGTSTVLTASGAATYSWSTGATTNTISLSPSTTTNYTVTGTTNGCNSSKTITVMVNTTPTVAVGNVTICAGSTATLTASGAATYSWNTGTTLSNITVTPTITTIYTVTGTTNGCSSTKTATVTVKAAPTITVNNTNICIGSSTVVTASGAVSYTWNTGATTPSISISPTVSTVYTVTGTNTLSCTASKTVMITVNSLPVLSLSASPATVCLSTSTLSASGAATYSWSTGATSSTIAVSPSVTTTYTLTGTSSLGCVSQGTISVSYGPVAPVITVTSNTNIACTGSTTLTASGAASYTWSPGGAITSTIAVSPTVTTVYTITSTYGTGCGSYTSTTIVNPNTSTLCCTPASLTIGTNLTSSVNMAPGNYTASGTIIDMKGTITFTGNTSFNGYTLRMAPGTKLVVDASVDLTLTNCKVFSCSELWDGIYLTENTTKIGNITLTNSTIEDMYNGIVMDCNNATIPTGSVTLGHITIDQSTLNKNYVSIQLKNGNGVSGGTPYNLALTSATISSNSSTTSPGSTLKPSSAYSYAYNQITNGTRGTSAPYLNFPRTYIGIYLSRLSTNSEVKIGDNSSSSYTNTFDNMDFGIYGKDVRLDVENNYFKNITGSYKSEDIDYGGGFPATGPEEIGVGVLVAHSAPDTYSLTVGTGTVVSTSNPYPKGNKFEDCNKGVKSDNASTTYVSGNIFTSASTDIPVITSTGMPPILINNPNTYYYYKAQNAAWFTGFEGSARFYYNYVRNQNVGAYVSVSTGTAAQIAIESNDIAAPSATGYCKNAVQLSQSAGTLANASVITNTISNVYNGVTAGSVLSGLQVNGNTISVETTAKTYNYNASTRRNGITLNYCEYVNVQGNNISGNGSVPTTSTTAQYLNGVYLVNSKLGKVECNSTTALGRDFVFEGTCNNSWKVNDMSNSYSGVELRNAGLIGQQGAASGTPNLSANTWTTITRQTSVISSAGTNTNSPLFLQGGGNTEPTLNFSTIAGQAYSAGLGGINVTTGTSYTCYGGYSAQRMGNSGSGKNNRAAENTDSLTLFSTLATNTENDYEVYPQEFTYHNKQMVYKLIKHDSIIPVDSSVLFNFYAANQNSAIDQLTQVQDALAMNDLTNAVIKNNSITVNNTVEQKHQRANELALKYLNDRSYQFTGDERSDLQNMANECLVKGYYVIQSRNILNMITNHSIVYDDNCDEEAVASRKKKITSSESVISFVLFPNPNNGRMQLDYDLGGNNSAIMNLYDVTGKLVKSYNLDGTRGSLQVNVQNLYNGIYFYRILVGDKVVKSDKIVIIR